jgi:hypothetical protein
MLVINTLTHTSSVVNQYYEAEVVSEYVIRGNTAVLKCNIPSFVADFVKVESWVGSEGTVYMPSADYGKVTIPSPILTFYFTGLSLTFSLFLAGKISCD